MKKGFTLIELLVVVIIVAVLTRIALPQYRRVVQKARVAEAQAMLRTLYDSSERLAVEFGAKDYDALYKDTARRPRATISRMDMFDNSGGTNRFRFACKVTNFRIICKHWTYSLVTLHNDTSYVSAIDANGDTIVALNRENMNWVCRPGGPEHEARGTQSCMAYDINDDDMFPGAKFDVEADNLD